METDSILYVLYTTPVLNRLMLLPEKPIDQYWTQRSLIDSTAHLERRE